MISLFMRPLGAALLSLSLAACAAPMSADAALAAPILGIDLGGSGPVTGHAEGHAPSTQLKSGVQMVHGGHNDAHGSGTINSIDTAGHKINISHGPIPSIGFPAMTMDFAVAPSVNLNALKPGMRVDFTIEQGASGMYEIQAVTPAGGR